MSIRISVVTPTYNRANTLHRVFESLNVQTCRDFEWIVVDDGSQDNTKKVVEEFARQADYEIVYTYQDNNGKHIAVNKGVSIAKGEFIAIADSDDSFVPESFEIMLKYWDDIEEREKKNFRGVTCRCYDPDTMEGIGRAIEGGYKDCLGLDATYKYDIDFEMWGINRKDVMQKYPFPDIRGGKKQGLSFFPETVIWNNMGREYKVRYIDECLRAYYRDQDNATTNKKVRRSKENIYLWEHLINDILDYAKYKPKRFIKAFVGITMDGFLNGESFRNIVKRGKDFKRKAIIILFSPVGYVLYLKFRSKENL